MSLTRRGFLAATTAGLDWDFWCGPAALRPYNRQMHPKGFRFFLDS